MEHTVVVYEVSYQKEQITYVEHLTFRARQGEIIGIFGPQSCGKTTVLELLAGMKETTTGSVELYGELVPFDEHARYIGYMMEQATLFETLTGQENIQYFSELYGLAGQKGRKTIQEMLRLVQLSDVQKRLVATYTPEMKKRLSLAITLVHHPPILLLDEPLISFDLFVQDAIWTYLRQLADSGTTIIFTSKAWEEVRHCDQVILLRNGKQVAVGTPQQLLGEHGVHSLRDVYVAIGGRRT